LKCYTSATATQLTSWPFVEPLFSARTQLRTSIIQRGMSRAFRILLKCCFVPFTVLSQMADKESDYSHRRQMGTTRLPSAKPSWKAAKPRAGSNCERMAYRKVLIIWHRYHTLYGMKMTMYIDDELLARVMDATGTTSKTKAIDLALREMDRRAKLIRLSAAG